MEVMLVEENVTKAMAELCYTASETGVLPFDLKDDGDDTLNTVIKLVAMAHKYAVDGVPNDLKM